MKNRSGKTVAVWALLVLGILFTASFLWGSQDVFADRGRGHGPGIEADFGQRIIHALSRLNVTEDQKHSIALVLKAHRDDARNLFQSMAEARKNLFTAMQAQDYNESAIRQAMQDVAKWEEDLAVLRAQVMHEIKGVLTPDQIAKLAAMRGHFGDRMKERIDRGFDRLDQWIDAHSA